MRYLEIAGHTEDQIDDWVVENCCDTGLRRFTTQLHIFALEKDEIMGDKAIETEDGVIVIPWPKKDPNYEERIKAEEHAYIQELYMTRSDFFDGTIKAFGADEDDLLTIITPLISQVSPDPISAKIALNNYKNALNFYRKHPLFSMLSNVPIPIGNRTITITEEQWDKFFLETVAGNENAYQFLLSE